ncbi:MAG: hypothetical protein ACHQDY_01015 [Solirubrobacterales bacterium]
MRKDALLIGVLLVLLAPAMTPLATAGASSAPAAASAVYLESQPTRLQIKPHSYYRHVSVHNLAWTNWGAPTATAQGTFTFQFCVEESCSVSPFYDEFAAVTLTAIKRCGTHPSYTILQLEVSGTLPDTSFRSYQTSLACPTRRVVRRRKHG